jgi:hypothetical protein
MNSRPVEVAVLRRQSQSIITNLPSIPYTKQSYMSKASHDYATPRVSGSVPFTECSFIAYSLHKVTKSSYLHPIHTIYFYFFLLFLLFPPLHCVLLSLPIMPSINFLLPTHVAGLWSQKFMLPNIGIIALSLPWMFYFGSTGFFFLILWFVRPFFVFSALIFVSTLLLLWHLLHQISEKFSSFLC